MYMQKNLKVINDTTYVFKLDIGGNYIVDNSTLNINALPTIKGYFICNKTNLNSSYRIESNGSNDKGYGISFIDSNVVLEGNKAYQILPHDAGLYMKETSLSMETGTLYSWGGEMYIESSEIICDNISKQVSNDNKVIFKNSKISANSQISVWSESDEQLVIIDNCEVESGELYIPKTGIIITNSKMKSTSDLFFSKNSTIKGSQIETRGGISKKAANDSGMLMIEDSEIIGCYTIGNSDTNPEELKAFIKNSKIIMNGTSSIFRGEVIFENCELDCQKLIYSQDNLTFNNCTGNLPAVTIVNRNFTINNSILKFSNEIEYWNSPPISVKNDFIINNSNIIADASSSDLIAIIVKNNIILDDNVVAIDNNKTRLKITEMSKEEIAQISPNQAQLVSEGDVVKIFTYEDNSYSKYVQLATSKTITFKVKNGTWLDGTTDDIKIDYLYGEKIEVEKLPDQVKELLSSKMGVWSMDLNNLDPTKDLEIEFKYDLINPDTSNKIVLLLVFVVILVVVLRNKKIYKKEF